jgi:hypothetical protein
VAEPAVPLQLLGVLADDAAMQGRQEDALSPGGAGGLGWSVPQPAAAKGERVGWGTLDQYVMHTRRFRRTDSAPAIGV